MKNSKIIDSLVTLVKHTNNVPLKRKELLGRTYRFFNPENYAIGDTLYFNSEQSEKIITEICALYKYKVNFQYNDFKTKFDTLDGVFSLDDIAAYITSLPRYVPAFEAKVCGIDIGFKSDAIKVGDGTVPVDALFWDHFDTWYSKNRKALIKTEKAAKPEKVAKPAKVKAEPKMKKGRKPAKADKVKKTKAPTAAVN